MNELEERIARLEKVLQRIEWNERYENYFDDLYKILEDEYYLEGGKDAQYIMGNYRHNLEQTIWKQARTYRETKRRRPKTGAPSEYRDFIHHFKRDVSDELSRCKYRLNPPN